MAGRCNLHLGIDDEKVEPRINVHHALHVLEIIKAARNSSATGTRIMLTSTFK